jgi:hypothetical protein
MISDIINYILNDEFNLNELSISHILFREYNSSFKTINIHGKYKWYVYDKKWVEDITNGSKFRSVLNIQFRILLEELNEYNINDLHNDKLTKVINDIHIILNNNKSKDKIMEYCGILFNILEYINNMNESTSELAKLLYLISIKYDYKTRPIRSSKKVEWYKLVNDKLIHIPLGIEIRNKISIELEYFINIARIYARNMLYNSEMKDDIAKNKAEATLKRFLKLEKMIHTTSGKNAIIKELEFLCYDDSI